MPPTDATDPVPPPVWRVISAETVAKAILLATRFKASRRDAAANGRKLGALLRDVKRVPPGPPPPSAEMRQRLTEYERLIKQLGFSRGTAVNLQYLAEISADKWDVLIGQHDVPPLTRLYMVGRKHKERRPEVDAAAAFLESIECVPDLVDLLARHEDRSTVLWIDTHYVAAGCVPPLCPPPDPSRVVARLRGLGPVRSLMKLMGLFEKHARAGMRAGASS